MIEELVSLSRMQDDVLQLDLIRHVEEHHFRDLAVVMGFSGQDEQPILTIIQQQLHYYPLFGYTSKIYLVSRETSLL